MLAIAGLDTVILKSATLSSTAACRPLAPLMFQAAAIVRVRTGAQSEGFDKRDRGRGDS